MEARHDVDANKAACLNLVWWKVLESDCKSIWAADQLLPMHRTCKLECGIHVGPGAQ